MSIFVYVILGLLLNVLCIWCIRLLTEKTLAAKRYLKYASGALLGLLLSFFITPFSFLICVSFLIFGALLSETLVLFYYMIKEKYKKGLVFNYYDDGTPPKIFITGDKHRDFEKVKAFCKDMNTRRKDILIVLGDTGFNYYEDARDDKLKKEISALNITLFCLYGNKENRPENIGTYGIRSFCGGKVYYEPKYPNLLFAIDGEVYTFEGKRYLVVGGAHSVDKFRCLEEGKPFFEDEMPGDAIKEKVEHQLFLEGNCIHGMLTHTCPIEYLPTEMFISTRQNAAIKRKPRKAKSKKMYKPDVDRSTEIWLGEIEKKLDYKVWFCGHYHVDKQLNKIHMMHREIRPLHLNHFGDGYEYFS